MKAPFTTSKLERAYEASARAIRHFGPEVGRRYVQRIDIIKASRHLEDLGAQRTLRCHELVRVEEVTNHDGN